MKLSSNALRRAAATIAMAGVAGLGTVALAPAASATLPAVDGSRYTVPGVGVGGPVAFLLGDHGRVAVFYCDPLNPDKLQNVCQPDPTTAPDRF